MLENVFNNAMRYAKQCINLDVSLNGQKLLFAIVDDGDGFSDETLSGTKEAASCKSFGGWSSGYGTCDKQDNYAKSMAAVLK